MNKFANLIGGTIAINTYRKPSAAATTLEDLIESHENESGENLTASIDTEDELNAIQCLIDDC